MSVDESAISDDSFGVQFHQQPTSRLGPIAFRRSQPDSERFGGFRLRQAGEEATLDDACLPLVELRKAGERFVERDDEIGALVGRECSEPFERKQLLTAAALFGIRPPRVLDENAPHRRRRNRKKMRMVGPSADRVADESEIRLVDQSGGREGVVRSFAPQVPAGQSTELVIDERKSPVECPTIATSGTNEKIGYARRLGQWITWLVSALAHAFMSIRSLAHACKICNAVCQAWPDSEQSRSHNRQNWRETMKMLAQRIRMGTCIFAVVSGAAMAAPSQAGAQAQPTIEGVWRVTRHGVNCQTGQEVNTFPVIMTFHKDGTTSGDAVVPGATPAGGTAEHGLWEREPGAKAYSFRLLSYSWDPATGAFTGSIEVSAKLQLTSDDTFAYESVIQFFDSHGNPSSSARCGRATGTRFE
jgi:hypothetical protein